MRKILLLCIIILFTFFCLEDVLACCASDIGRVYQVANLQCLEGCENLIIKNSITKDVYYRNCEIFNQLECRYIQLGHYDAQLTGYEVKANLEPTLYFTNEQMYKEEPIILSVADAKIKFELKTDTFATIKMRIHRILRDTDLKLEAILIIAIVTFVCAVYKIVKLR